MEENKKKLTKGGIHALVDPYWWLILQVVILFIAAGRLDMPQVWLYFIVVVIASTLINIILFKYALDLLNKRGEMPEGTPTWDKICLAVLFGNTLIFIPLVAGLDIGRFLWSNLGFFWMIVGIVMYSIGAFLVYWAMIINQHFEGTARIQKDRDHQAVTKGPYKIVRHPGYVGMLLGLIAAPLMLGSLFALIPALIACISLIVRTSLEDKMLRNELKGYSEYAKKVKYRLLPGIW